MGEGKNKDMTANLNSPAYEEFLKTMRDQCICGNLRKATRIITRRYDEVYADVGISSAQTALLSVLMLRGETPMGVLADDLGMEKSTLSRNFKLMETRGLVARTVIDGRTFGASITTAGQKVLGIANGLWQKIQDDMLKNVRLDDWKDSLAVIIRLSGRAADSNRVS